MELYERYGRALRRKAERVLQSRSDAEDVVQTLFLDLWRRGETHAELPYLFRAVTHRCLNLLRDARNRQRLLEHHEPALRFAVRTRCDERAIDLDLLVRLVDRLDGRGREVLVYRYFDDMTQDEIATVMQVSRKTVGKRLDRIRDELTRLAAVENPS